VGRHRAHLDLVVVDGDAGQFVDAVDVDEVVGRGQPVGHDDAEALVAGEQFGVVAEVRQQLRGLGDGRRSVVLEGGRLHGGRPPACGAPLVRGERYLHMYLTWISGNPVGRL